MDLNLSSNSIVGLACCGISFSDKNMKQSTAKFDDYIVSSGEIKFPFIDLIVDRSFILNSVCYSIQIVPISSNNEYAVISGNNYSVFKVIDKRTDNIRLLWNGESYIIETKKNLNILQLTINETTVIEIETIDNPILQSLFITFPTNPILPSNELNLLLDQCLSELDKILNGYNLPEPFFTDNIYLQLEKIFTILRDPLLPSWQFQRYLDSVMESLPKSLVNDLQQIIGHYTSNFSSLFSRFPSNKIKSLIDTYMERLNNNSSKRDMSVIVRPILELTEMYSNGTRGNAKDVIEKLLLDYLRVEIKFQNTDTILKSHTVNRTITINDAISHNNIKEKNKLILTLLEFLEKFLPGVILDLRVTIQRLLTNLTGSPYSLVISKLREVLIIGQIPSYEVRRNEMETVFLNSINGYCNGTQTGRLENLICSNSEVFDIISDFFYHKKTEIRKCAMEVYVRRAYMDYEICSFEQSQLTDGQLCLLFKYSLPRNNKNEMSKAVHELKRSNSYVGLMDSKFSGTRKSSPIYQKRTSSGFIEKDDLSDEELSMEDCYLLNRQKSNDYDTDSAISVGACSLLDLSSTVSDCLLDTNMIRSQPSPSIYSLDRFSIPSNYSSFKDNVENIKRSEGSLNKSTPYKCNRSVSMFCNNKSLVQAQGISSQYDFGVMIIFDTMDEIERNLPAIKDLLSVRNSAMDVMDYMKYDMTTLDRDCSPVFKVILKLILRDLQLINKCETDIAAILKDFCDRNLSFFDDICVIRITFLLQSTDKTIRYFTFRMREQFEEDIKLRNIDPILSFQLEMKRLRNYHLERMSVPNHRMYVYMATHKEESMAATAEYRMFTRCIIYHKDINVSTSNIDFMAREAERNLLEAMDAFDIAWNDERARFTKLNHIFVYFHSILCINKIDELESVVRSIVFKYGRRLWSLRITQAELKMSVKLNNGLPTPIRLLVHNEGGKSLDIAIYREEYQYETGPKVLISLSPNSDGRYHGVPVNCFYSN